MTLPIRSATRALSSATLAALVTALPLLLAPASAQAGSARIVRHNPGGGITAAAGVVRRGPAGTRHVRGHRLVTDGQGNAVRTSGAATVGPRGGRMVRHGAFTRSADGAWSRSGTAELSGARGSVAAERSASRSAAGELSLSRSTTATSAASGNSVQATRSYDSDSGASRSVTCFDAGGTPMPCRPRP